MEKDTGLAFRTSGTHNNTHSLTHSHTHTHPSPPPTQIDQCRTRSEGLCADRFPHSDRVEYLAVEVTYPTLPYPTLLYPTPTPTPTLPHSDRVEYLAVEVGEGRRVG